MKTIRMLLIVTFVWLALPTSVSAFYNPSTGRWLNRDPVVEPPFFALTRSEIGLGDMRLGYGFFGTSTPQADSHPRSLYAFVENSSLELTDYLGLMTEPGLREGKSASFQKDGPRNWLGLRCQKDGCSVPSASEPPGGTKDDPTGKCSFAGGCKNHDLCYSNRRSTSTDCDEKWSAK